MKKLFTFISLCMIAFNAIHAEITWNLSNDGTLTISGTGDIKENHWYSQKDRIKKVVIEDGVTSIGEYAFYNCSALTSITIPNSVTMIGGSAFYVCSSLTSITIPNSVTSIGDKAFYNCSSITSIAIPNSVTSIGKEAFYGCSGLSSITISNSVTSIEARTFACCAGLTSITIPNSVTSIGQRAFSVCLGLTSITIPNSVTSIDWGAFSDCESLTSVAIPNSMTYIGDYAFSGCSSLTSVAIPNSVKSIAEKAFRECSGLTSITIPNSVTRIGNSTFEGCTCLKSITIPNSVTKIDSYAFEGCSGLTSVTNLATTPQKIQNNTFSVYGTLHVLPGCKAKYAAADVWKNFTIVEDATYSFTWELSNGGTLTISGTSMPDYSTTRPWGAQQTEIKVIIIANGVTNIGSYAFSDCRNLTSITIPETVTSIGNYTFSGCSNLTSVTNLSTTPQKISASTFTIYGTLHVLPGCKAKYATADFWNNFEIVEDATTGIDVVEKTPTISADKIFSISGQQLDKIKKGVNIINGKKIIVK